MFLENYRYENVESMTAGGAPVTLPYPKISAEDWRVWTTFLPVRSHDLERKGAGNFSSTALQDLPAEVAAEIKNASRYFERVEVWRKNQVEKDPIAVGVVGQDRYLIARWGLEKLIPFDTIKKSMPLVLAWRYATSNFGLTLQAGAVALLAWSLLG